MEMPLDLQNIVDLMHSFDKPWAVCGGWAIDLYMGRVIRSHKDIDISVLRQDQLCIQSFLRERGWSLEIADDGNLTPWKEGEYLQLPLHGIWCKNSSHTPDFLEILLDEGDDTTFCFRRDTSIQVILENAYLQTEAGVPFLAPEIALLYKARNADIEYNAEDFQNMLPHLSLEQRLWLRTGIKKLYPGSSWLGQL